MLRALARVDLGAIERNVARLAAAAAPARLIARKRHNRLPVIEHGRLVGVVTRVDVLDALTAEG